MVATEQQLPYPVTIAAGALETLGEVLRVVAPQRRWVAITDATVGALYQGRIAKQLAVGGPPVTIASFGVTERTKTRETWGDMTDFLLANQCGRDTTLVAIGGGVIGDVVGFVAATYMRGIPYVQVPTTLLAMVDASIGGKTGVDTPRGKNLVGAFHQPVAVVIDPQVLGTLPHEQLHAGFAEVIKHGVVADAEYFRQADAFARAGALAGRDWQGWTSLITRSVEIKSDIVARDEREGGLRKVLNFGHTIAHAIEAASGYSTLHGEAVAIGMVTEARIAQLLGITGADTVAEIERVCREAGLPTRPQGLDADALLEFTRTDKKARAGKVEYALPARIGEMASPHHGYGTPVDDRTVREALGA